MPRLEPVPPLPAPLSRWWLLGMLVPIVVLGLAIAWLGRPLPPELDREAQAIDQRLQAAGEEGPAVVVLGNSLVLSGLHLPTVAAALELPKKRVVAATVTGSHVATWYAVLRHRILDAGHRPGLVLIGGSLDGMLDPGLSSPSARAKLLGQLGGPDPVVDRLVFGQERGLGPLRNAADRRGAVRAGVLDGVREAVEALVVPGQDGEALLAEVVAAERLRDQGGPGGVMEALVRDEEGAATGAVATGVRPPEQGFLPELLRLAEEHELKLVFVRLPEPPGAVDSPEALAQHRALVAQLNESPHATWVDLSALPLEPGDFADHLHYGARGRELVSAALAAELGALRGHEGRALPAAALPEAPVVWEQVDTWLPVELGMEQRAERSCLWWGTPRDRDDRVALSGDGLLRRAGLVGRSPFEVREQGVALERAAGAVAVGRDGCDGVYAHVSRVVTVSPRPGPTPPGARRYTLGLRAPDADDEGGLRWLAPGSVLSTTVSLAAGDTLSVLAVPRGTGRAPRVWLGGEQLSLEPLPGGMLGLRLLLEHDEAGLSIEVPEDGPVLGLVEIAQLRAEGGRRLLLDGTPGAPAVHRLLDGPGATSLGVAAGPAPALELPGRVQAHKGSARFVGLGPLLADIAQLRDQLPRADAAPVFAVVHGVQGAEPLGRCYSVGGLPPGEACHNDRALYLGRATGQGAEAAAETLELVLRPERLHRGSLWLYPGDRVGLELPPAVLHALPAGTNQLRLSALLPARPRGLLSVRLFVQDLLVMEQVLRLRELAGGPAALALDPALRDRASALRLELELDSGASAMVLQDVSLVRDEDLLWGPANTAAR